MAEQRRNRVGVTGLTHQSIAEAEASFQLAPLGIMPDQQAYPATFADSDGATFAARPDFRHEASGVWVEFKACNLNSKRTKALAAKAEARVHRDEALGFLSPRKRQYRLLDAQWNHSVHKLGAVVSALSPANVLLLLRHEPTEEEAAKLLKAGIFWRTMKTIPAYALYLKLASQGLAVGFTASAAATAAEDDTGPWHVFGIAAEA